MKQLIALICIHISMLSYSQSKTIIYCFPGQGSDSRLFDSLDVKGDYELKIIEYGAPDKSDDLKSFAQQFIVQIDTNRAFILLGVSMGGMICSELNELLNPQKTIVISSAKNRNELPFRYRFQKTFPIYKIVPGWLILMGAKLLQPLVEPDRNRQKSTFKSMLSKKDATYMKRTVGLIINWERTQNRHPIYHIHGTKDHTLPIRKIKGISYTVENGSHMMTLTRSREISALLIKILEEK